MTQLISERAENRYRNKNFLCVNCRWLIPSQSNAEMSRLAWQSSPSQIYAQISPSSFSSVRSYTGRATFTFTQNLTQLAFETSKNDSGSCILTFTLVNETGNQATTQTPSSWAPSIKLGLYACLFGCAVLIVSKSNQLALFKFKLFSGLILKRNKY